MVFSMKRILIAVTSVLLGCAAVAQGQSPVAITATVTGANGAPYEYGSYQIALVDSNGKAVPSSGTVISATLSGPLDSTGSLAVSLYPSSAFAPPAGATSVYWKFFVCSAPAYPAQASFVWLDTYQQCYSSLVTVTSAGSYSTAVSTGAPAIYYQDNKTGLAYSSGGGGANATTINGAVVPTSASFLGSNISSQPVVATGNSLATLRFGTDTGTAQAHVIALSPAITSNASGTEIFFIPLAANTATAPTLAVNGLAALPITVCGTSGALAGDLLTTTVADVVSDGTRWQLKNPATTNCGSVVASLQAGTGTPLPGAVINATQSNVGVTTQINVQNTSSDNAASSDLVATSDNGSQTTNYVDLGCNSSTYNQAAYNSGAADDCYVYASNGNFNIATAASGKTVTINIGGTMATQTTATFNATGLALAGNESAATYSTATNCAINAASPGACGSASAGAFVVPTATVTYTVNTTAVTTHSRIMLTPITFASDLPSTPTCVIPLVTTPWSVSGVVAGTSFTVTLTSTTGQTCFYYEVEN